MTENVCNLLDNLTKHNSRAFGYELSQNEVLQILKLFDDVKELEQYRAIGTVDELKALKEKSVAKKMDRYYCPICRHYFEDGELHNYCPECGQLLET